MDSKNDDFQKDVYILPSKIILESRAPSETTEFQTTSKYRDLAKDYCGLYPLHPISELVLGKKFQQKGKMLQNLAYYCMYIMALCQNFSLSTNPEIERVQYLQKAKDTQYAFQGSKCLKLIKTIKKIKSNATGKRFIIFLISKHFHMPTQ